MEANVITLAAHRRDSGTKSVARHASIFDPPSPDDALHRKLARVACQISDLRRFGPPGRCILDLLHEEVQEAMFDAYRLEGKLERIDARRLARAKKRRRVFDQPR